MIHCIVRSLSEVELVVFLCGEQRRGPCKEGEGRFQSVQNFGEGEGQETSTNKVTHECMID